MGYGRQARIVRRITHPDVRLFENRTLALTVWKWPRPALPQFDDDHIVTGRCPAHTGRSRRDRPQTARQPTASRGARYRQVTTQYSGCLRLQDSRHNLRARFRAALQLRSKVRSNSAPSDRDGDR